MLKNLLKTFNYIFPFVDFLYILQLEEYDNTRYAKRIKRFFIKRNIQKRDVLKFTSRIQTTFILSVGIYVISLFFILLSPIFFFISTFLIPIYILAANILLTYFYEFMKYKLQLKAKSRIEKLQTLKIVGVAGSYGKTTTKNFIYEFLKYKYRLQMVPGNINTPTGVAAWVLKELSDSTELLIVEMDSYFIGEIKRTCMITPPNIAVITSIGDQHIERFKTKKNMARAILEIFDYSRDDASLLMFKKDAKTLRQLNLELHRSVTLLNHNKLTLKTNILSNSAKEDLILSIAVAETLDIPLKIIKDTCLYLTLPDRRQREVLINGYHAIDDSYNISATTAREGVKAGMSLAKRHKKKLLVITAGIPELAPNKSDENKKYGEFLSNKAAAVIILKSIFHPDLLREGFKEANNMKHAWEIARKFSSKKYVLLIQPELTDLYY